MKSLITLLLLAGLVYAAYYLYRFDKKNGLAKTSAISKPSTDITTADQPEKTQIPIYLTEEFWRLATPQELENQLKTRFMTT
ncbi:MAG: hypothetical protein OXJ52_06290 [Oligoflexia bacterium]|nr:hypothetical protein [Oligoflexia bacterium]